ncbi:MAG: hypothetical protein EX263_11510 [Flavobacteriaceae bacterium]|nr:MAG: hypothetical protein EX263_11510 [Flavobacteriaceae bacterium]
MRIILTSIALLTLLFKSYGQEGLSFKTDQQFYLKGKSTIIGNTILSTHKTRAYNDNSGINDLLKLEHIDVDDDRSTFNSSKAILDLNVNPSKLKYAALYWSAIYKYDKGKKVIERTDNGKKTLQRIVYDGKESRSNDVHKVILKLPNGADTSINGSIIFDSYQSQLFEDTKPYVCYADVTDLLKSQNSLSGIYTLANIRATEGYVSGGASGGWLLYMIYEDDESANKFFTTFNGFVEVAEKPVDIVFSGFNTSGIGKVNTSLSLGSLEGDRKIRGDDCLFFDSYTKKYVPLTSPLRPENNYFNGSITVDDPAFTNRIPNSSNNLGFDLVKQNIPYNNTASSANDLTRTAFRFKTTSDRFYLFFVAFETEISAMSADTNNDIALNDTSAIKTKDINTINTTKTNGTSSSKKSVTPNTNVDNVPTDELTQEEALAKIVALKTTRVPNLTEGYYLVTNVFAIEKNALKWMKFLLNNGYNPGVYINPENGWHYVYVDDSEDPLPVYLKRKEISSESFFKDLWIHKINL